MARLQEETDALLSAETFRTSRQRSQPLVRAAVAVLGELRPFAPVPICEGPRDGLVFEDPQSATNAIPQERTRAQEVSK
jgi:hypothetical protein